MGRNVCIRICTRTLAVYRVYNGGLAGWDWMLVPFCFFSIQTQSPTGIRGFKYIFSWGWCIIYMKARQMVFDWWCDISSFILQHNNIPHYPDDVSFHPYIYNTAVPLDHFVVLYPCVDVFSIWYWWWHAGVIKLLPVLSLNGNPRLLQCSIVFHCFDKLFVNTQTHALKFCLEPPSHYIISH